MWSLTSGLFQQPRLGTPPVSTISLCTARRAPPWSKSSPTDTPLDHSAGSRAGLRPQPQLPPPQVPPYVVPTTLPAPCRLGGHPSFWTLPLLSPWPGTPVTPPYLPHTPASCICPATPGSIPSPLRCPCISFPEGPALKSHPLSPCFTLGATVLSASPSPVYCPCCPGSQQALIK